MYFTLNKRIQFGYCIHPHYGLDGPGIKSRGRGARFSAPVQTGPGALPAFYATGACSFPGVKRPGRGVDHPSISSAEVKERVEVYLYSPSGPSWSVLGQNLTFYLYCMLQCDWVEFPSVSD